MCEGYTRFQRLEALFADPPVRVRLARSTLHELNPIVEIRCVQVEELSPTDLFPPWYIDTAGNLASWDVPGARPLSFADVVSETAPLPRAGRRRARDLAESLAGRAEPLVIPSYALSGGRTLVLDGNHRLLGCLRESVSATVLLLRIRGPLSGMVLPDLGYWS
jgi:hypothetical protein